MASRSVPTEDPSSGRNGHRMEQPTHKSAVANYIKQGHSNAGCLGLYYGRKKRSAAEEIDIVKEKIASFKKIRKVKTTGELMAELNRRSSVDPPTLVNGAALKYKHAPPSVDPPTLVNGAALRYKHVPPPEKQERKPRVYYACTPTSVTGLKISRKYSPPQNEPSKKYSVKEDILQKASSLNEPAKKYVPLTRNNKPQESSLEKNISQSNQASNPFSSKAFYRNPSTKNYSSQGFSSDEDQMYQYSSPILLPENNNMSQELPILDSQVSQPKNNSPKKLPLEERSVPERFCQKNSRTTTTKSIPMKPANTFQKASPLEHFTNGEFLPANDGSSQGPSTVSNDKPPTDQPTERDIIPQEDHSNATLKMYCDYMKRIGVQKVEGLTGNYCFKDDVFREWHEGLYRPTYGGKLLEILPYSLTD